MKPEFADFRIDELLHRLDVEFAPLAREKGLDLTFMPCSQNVRSDRRLLRRLLQNLISNAIKYTPAGRVLVGCRRRGGRLRIEVYDTGIGIPHAKRRAVFKEFHRLDQGARVARGVGFGLSIVERIARVLDCEVTLKSNVGRGSRFSIEVPRGAGQLAAPKLRAPPRLDVGRLDGTVVLCIDNERAILDGMETLLGRLGLPHACGGRLQRGDRGDRRQPISNPTDFWSTITSTAATALRQSRNCAAASAVMSRRS